MLNEYFYLGKITKTFGIRGEVLVYLDTDEPEKYYKLELVFFNIKGEPIPFFINSVKIKSKQQLIVKFEEIDNDNAASYIDTQLYLPLSLLPPLGENKFYYHEVKGFKMIDKQHGDIGICEDILEYPHQAIFQIKHPKGTILVPIVDQYIIKVDKTNKIIELDTPTGLIEIYLSL
ncbi:MAG TPA: ribosome maturation factor RimM [Bacteroidales bacterium]|nr:ribosome maturation factor RimM [Bacteroidales bacterium]